MSVGNNIKKRRFELKISQQELADAMGYKTRSTIAKIESGENDVSQKKLQKFAEVLYTTPEALISGYTNDAENSLPSSVDFSQTNKNIVIILAGGKSCRNRQNIPSQFISIHGKPILVYCMEVYQTHPAIDEIHVVCLKGWEKIVMAYAKQYGITKIKNIITGGNSGIASLQNALENIKSFCCADDLIIIQESTRPMVSHEMITRLLQNCIETGSATMCHSMNEYVQFDNSNKKPKYIDRNSVIALQSPEAHRYSIIKEVFEIAQHNRHQFTESCFTMLMYNLGYNINFVESGINNIKITYEEDIAAFSVLVKNSPLL